MHVTLKSRNFLSSKLTGTTWGASAYISLSSVAEYCVPIWTKSSYSKLVDSQQFHAIDIWRITAHSTSLVARLPVLANIAPPELRWKAASDTFLDKVLAHLEWPVHNDVTNRPSSCLMSRRLWSGLDRSWYFWYMQKLRVLQ